MEPVSLFDRVRILPTAATETIGVAGRIGIVHGETTPSVTSVEVVGGVAANHAFCVRFEDEDRELWFAPHLVELVDHAPGSTIRIGGQSLIRDVGGEWRNLNNTSQD
jgi:hypothetical protein